jgi:hypothetical protein
MVVILFRPNKEAVCLFGEYDVTIAGSTFVRIIGTYLIKKPANGMNAVVAEKTMHKGDG